jgi:hypothetical protein
MTTTAEAIDECGAIMHVMASSEYATTDVRWNGKESNEPPLASSAWFRWSMLHTGGEQASLSCEGGKRRWRRDGLIIVQCFAPLDKGGLTLAQRMAESVRDAYQGSSTPSGVWFRNATTQEVGIDKAWYQVNAVIQFTYDEVR